MNTVIKVNKKNPVKNTRRLKYFFLNSKKNSNIINDSTHVGGMYD